MKIVTRSIVLGVLACMVPLSAFAAHPAAANKATFHVSSKFMHRSAWMHVMGSATLKYTKNDASVTVTTTSLPAASTLGKSVYVLFASDGSMTSRVGALKVSGKMAGLKNAMVMMSKIKDLYIYAEPSAGVKKPGNGTLVLSAMVG